MSEKKFPILGTNESIDWNLIAPHEKQAMENHWGQTLEQLARRHGLSWYELLCVLLDKPFTEVEYDKEKNYKELCQMALVSEEVKQYRAIGTVEECRAAVEKQKAKKPMHVTNSYFGYQKHKEHVGYCPDCGHQVEEPYGCPNCLRKIDWGDEE
nr:MAG TPA: zinc-ribbon domain protein [Caudoviricetes sp.]